MRIERAEEFERICAGEGGHLVSRGVEADEAVWFEIVRRFPDRWRSVVANRQVPLAVLAALLEGDPEIRGRIATKRRLSPELFERLARDPDPGVRQALAGNVKLPEELLERLLVDEDPYVRESAEEEIARRTDERARKAAQTPIVPSARPRPAFNSRRATPRTTMIELRDFDEMPRAGRGLALLRPKAVPQSIVVFGEPDGFLAEAKAAAVEVGYVPMVGLLDPLSEYRRYEGTRGQGAYVVEADLSACRSEGAVLRTIGEAFRFPAYYGENWDALLDCFQDCLWLPPGAWTFRFRGMSPLRATLPGAAQNLMEFLADINRADAEGMDADLTPDTHPKRFVFEFAADDRPALKRDRRYVWRSDPVDGEGCSDG